MRQSALPPHRYYNVTEESKQVMGRANRCPPKSKQAREALSFFPRESSILRRLISPCSPPQALGLIELALIVQTETLHLNH